MSKVEELELVADMVGLEADYVVEEADFFRSVNEAFPLDLSIRGKST